MTSHPQSAQLSSSGMAVSPRRRAIRGLLRPVSRLAARRREKRTIVLMYHAIGYSPYGVRPEDFAAQMEYLKAHARVVPLEQIVNREYRDSSAQLTCAITFDDGYTGVYDYAYPVLQKHRFASVLYVTTSALDRSGPDKNRDIPGFFPGEPTLNWVQVREMSEGGITIGSHLCHHHDMRKLSARQGMEELSRSKQIISHKLGAPCNHFAYPSGLFTREGVKWVVDAGYHSAVTVSHSVVPEYVDCFRIPRMSVGPENSWADFCGMLRGDLDYLLIIRKVRNILNLPV